MITAYDFFSSQTDEVDVLQNLYPCQRDVILNYSEDNVVCNPRQTGKTTLIVSAVIHFALYHGVANKVVGYFCDSRRHGQDLLWQPLLWELDRLGIEYHSNSTELVVALWNGAKIEIFGIDDARKASRLRGYQWIAVFIDECQSIPDDILKMVVDSETHAGRQALKAPLFLLGTPSPVATGTFYDAVHLENSYKKFHWDQESNVLFPRWVDKEDKKAAIREWLQHLVDTKFGSWDNAEFRREYLCEWVSDAGKLMLHLSEHNVMPQLPLRVTTRNVLGIDLGWHDNTSWNLVGYDTYAGKCYHLFEHQQNRLTINPIIDKTKELIELYHPEHIVVDSAGAGKIILETLVEELRVRFGVPVEAAPKREKAVYVRLLDSDLLLGNTYVIKDSNTWKQFKTTIWNKKAEREQEGQPVDSFDSFLYAWRYALHHFRRIVEKLPAPGTPEWFKAEEKRMRDDALATNEYYRRMENGEW